LFVGLMSGTSADGIDAAVAKISGRKVGLRVELVAHFHRPFSPSLRRRILYTSSHGRVQEICELNFLLGKQFAQAALAVLQKAKPKHNPRSRSARQDHSSFAPSAPTPTH